MVLAVVLCILGVVALATAAILLLRTPTSQPGVGPILLEQALDRDLRRVCRLLRSHSDLDAKLRRQLARFIIEQASRRVEGTVAPQDHRRVRRLLRALRSADPPSALDRQGWHG